MAEPLEYQIVLNIQATLLTIAIASGYFHDVQSLGAVKLDIDQDVDALFGATRTLPIAVVASPFEETVFAYEKSKRGRIEVPFAVHWFNKITTNSDEARTLSYFRAMADVEKALSTDISRGGLATVTTLKGHTLRPESKGLRLWAQMRGTFAFHRQIGQP